MQFRLAPTSQSSSLRLSNTGLSRLSKTMPNSTLLILTIKSMQSHSTPTTWDSTEIHPCICLTYSGSYYDLCLPAATQTLQHLKGASASRCSWLVPVAERSSFVCGQCSDFYHIGSISITYTSFKSSHISSELYPPFMLISTCPSKMKAVSKCIRNVVIQ